MLKRIISVILTLTIFLALFSVDFMVTYAVTECDRNGYILGDTDNSGEVNIWDCTDIQRYLASLIDVEGVNCCAMDTNGDGRVSISDATVIQKHLANLPDRNLVGKKVIPDTESTKANIYGISFDTTDSDSACNRTGSAVNMKADYVIADKYSKLGFNDFDYAYPWCDIRRCNVTFSSAGRKIVTYEGEEKFSTEGKNGNVMVEIPKFYTRRTLNGTMETWEITGTPQEGFEIEPAFLDNKGNELDFIYVGAYEFSGISDTKLHSVANQQVKTTLTMGMYRTIAQMCKMSCIDYATIHALQFLFTIEFADRDTDKFMQGMSALPYFNNSNCPAIKISQDRKTLTVPYDKRTRFFRKGQNVLICRNTVTLQKNLTITEVSVNESQKTVDVTLDLAVSDSVDVSTGNVYVAGQPQSTGKCDDLQYHTGRVYQENSVSPFRYRYMENLWGNAWKLVEGLRIKELDYYYTYNTELYGEKTVAGWKKSGIKAPEQPYLGDNVFSKAWITEMGFDSKDSRVILPSTTGKDGDTGKFYSSAFYSQYETDKNGAKLEKETEYLCILGGGFDHGVLCGPFTMRFWFSEGKERSAFHTSRLVMRK